MSEEAQAAPQAFPPQVDVAQALVGKTFSQIRVSGKTRGSRELTSKMHLKGEERVFLVFSGIYLMCYVSMPNSYLVQCCCLRAQV